MKKLITTSFNANGKGSILIYEGDKNGNRKVDDEEIQVTELNGNGDFRSEECVELLKQADIVVTNPPFSLAREYFKVLFDNNVKFLVISPQNAITYKEIFPYIIQGKLWLGHNMVHDFVQPDGNMKKFGNISWFTNMETNKQNNPKCLIKTYNPTDYQQYDNYNAINVDKVKDIPYDYEGVIGVPITILNELCSDGLLHFEAPMRERESVRTESSVLPIMEATANTTCSNQQSISTSSSNEYSFNKYRIIDANDCHRQGKRKSTMLVKDADSAINGKPTYARILIQRV